MGRPLLSRIESKLGSLKFALLILSIVLLDSVMEVVMHKYFDVACGVGFSGVLMGLASWELVMQGEVDLYLLLAIAVRAISPSFQDKRASLVGHAIGALSGLMIGLIMRRRGKVT